MKNKNKNNIKLKKYYKLLLNLGDKFLNFFFFLFLR